MFVYFRRLKSLKKCQFQFHCLVQSNLRPTVRAEGKLRMPNRFAIGSRNLRKRGRRGGGSDREKISGRPWIPE